MKKILIAAVMICAFSVAASAQALFQVGSTPVTTVASCGVTELTGDIVFTQVAGSPDILAGTITVNYGVPITTITGATLTVIDSTNSQISQTTISASSVSGNQLVLTITPPASGTAPYTFRLSGVRVNVAGNPSLTSLSANVSSTVNSFVGGQTNVVVISAISSAISSIDTLDGFTNTALNINAVSPSGGTVKVDVVEGFANAFVQNAIVGLTFTSIPAGVELSFPTSVTATGGVPATAQTIFTLTDSTGVPIASQKLTSTSTNLTVYYEVTTSPSSAVVLIETLRVEVTVGLATVRPSPLPQGSVSVTADLYPRPVGDIFFSIIPQYAGTTCQRGPVTVLTILTGNTSLLIPYAISALGYDTGIAIANTTEDPFSGTSSAVPQNGTITFTFFPQTGDSFSYTTDASSPGEGLTSGVLNAGRLYAVLLSQLLEAAGGPADFAGYVFAVVNATNAHGQYFISDFEAFTNGALMLVVDPTLRRTTPETLGN